MRRAPKGAFLIFMYKALRLFYLVNHVINLCIFINFAIVSKTIT